jgi:putative peptidoglycan lipid II flippase
MKRQNRNVYATRTSAPPPDKPARADNRARPPARRDNRTVYATRIDPTLPTQATANPGAPRPQPPERTPRPPAAPRRSGGGLVRASVIIMLAYIASRVLGLVRELVISYQFGTSRELDAYQAAFRIPDLIFQIVAAGAMGAAFIPVFTSYLARQDDDEAWRMASTVINATFIVMTAAALLAAIFADQLVPLVAPGFDPDARALTANLMRIMLIQAVVVGMSGLVTAVLQSYRDFLLPALAPVAYNLSIIAGGLFLAPRAEFGVYGLAIGVAVGGALHLLIQLPALRRPGVRYRPQLDLRHSGARQVGALMLPRIAGLGALQINFLATTILASRLVEGSIAALNYAFQLLMLPWGVFANAISTAVFPTLSQDAALDRRDELTRVLSLALRTILYLTVPAGVGLFVLREPLIRLLFERGQFTAASTAMTAQALMFYAPALFAIATTEIVTRGFYALKDTRTPVLVGVATVTLNIILSLILSRSMGHGGLALAYSLANIVETVILLTVIRGRLGGLDGQRLAMSVLRIVVAAAIMGEGLALGVYAAGDLLVSASLLVRFILVSILMVAGAAIYLSLTVWLGSEEITSLAHRRAEK